MYNVTGMCKSKRGFTLIELLVSIGVLAVLSAGVISLIGPSSRQYARDVRRQSDLNNIASALGMYRNENVGYPTTTQYTTENVLVVQNYISAIPVDPQNGSAYVYTPTCGASCRTFSICATMEKAGTPLCVSNP